MFNHHNNNSNDNNENGHLTNGRFDWYGNQWPQIWPLVARAYGQTREPSMGNVFKPPRMRIKLRNRAQGRDLPRTTATFFVSRPGYGRSEMESMLQGREDLFFYGWKDDDALAVWHLIDLREFRRQCDDPAVMETYATIGTAGDGTTPVIDVNLAAAPAGW